MGGIAIEVIEKNNLKTKMDIEQVLKYEIAGINILKYNIEVIKAITVLKRSELAKRIKNLPYYTISNREYIIVDDNPFNCLTAPEKNLIEKAIQDSEGIIATCSGKAVDGYFTANCGGGTANSEDVLGHRINYLRKVLCRFCSENLTENIIDVNEIAVKLNVPKSSYKEEIKGIITDVERDETGRIITLSVMGTRMTGDEFSKLICAKSSRMYFLENSIAFKSIGEGVGLGVCLEGAESLAEKGFGFKDIIKYYYTGVDIEQLDEKSVLKTLTGKKIIIDPGHGGKDIGNTINDITEKNTNLSIALELERKLKLIGADVHLTRISDIDMPAGDRVKIINQRRPEIFISIHQNNFMFPGINGVEAYCYDKDEEAKKLGKCITEFISEKMDVKNRGVKIGDYYLLRESRVSGLILECMYMSGNLDSLKYSEENNIMIAEAIFLGICKYYDIEP